MSADNRGSKPDADPIRYYQPPAVVQSPQWPKDVLVGDFGPASLRAKLERTAGGAPTLYRPDTLAALAGTVDDAVLAQLNAGLAPLNWSLTLGDATERGDEVTLKLSAVAGGGPLDAWQALEQLRSLRGTSGITPATSAAIDGLALQRLYFAGLKGLPAKDGHAGVPREAVAMVGAPQVRSAPDWVPGGRRPVVALIDSGVGRHPWLAGADGDPFWVDATALGWTGAPNGLATDQGSGDIDPADGVLDTHAGHATFIAGLIRQLAPDARVLSMYAMRGGGVLDETVVLCALDWLLDRVRRASADSDSANFVDVVNLSFGYYEHLPADHRHTVALSQILGELGSLGVQVVASAGNDSTAQPVFPAAFADPAYSPRPAVPLIGVGALNPDGSFADYSNFGLPGEVWAPGTAVTSTFPRFSRPPGPVTLAYKPGNLTSGFARWGGTSFAAGVVAGRIARALSDAAAGDHGLEDVSPEAACERANRALAAVTAEAVKQQAEMAGRV
jgi:Subtilase family